jgi:4a-hydroxytetrahydrobiopterin dehydratase
MAGTELLSAAEIDRGLADLPGWRRQDGVVRRSVRTDGFPAAVGAVESVVADCEALDHHPDVDIRYDTVVFSLTTHSAGGVTAADLELARRIEAVVGSLDRGER